MHWSAELGTYLREGKGVTNGGTHWANLSSFDVTFFRLLAHSPASLFFSLLSPSLVPRPEQCPLVFVLTTIKLLFFLLFTLVLSFFLLSIKLFVYG